MKRVRLKITSCILCALEILLLCSCANNVFGKNSVADGFTDRPGEVKLCGDRLYAVSAGQGSDSIAVTAVNSDGPGEPDRIKMSLDSRTEYGVHSFDVITLLSRNDRVAAICRVDIKNNGKTSGSYVCVVILDVSDPSSPKVIGGSGISGSYEDCAVIGDSVAVAVTARDGDLDQNGRPFCWTDFDRRVEAPAYSSMDRNGKDRGFFRNFSAVLSVSAETGELRGVFAADDCCKLFEFAPDRLFMFFERAYREAEPISGSGTLYESRLGAVAVAFADGVPVMAGETEIAAGMPDPQGVVYCSGRLYALLTEKLVSPHPWCLIDDCEYIEPKEYECVFMAVFSPDLKTVFSGKLSEKLSDPGERAGRCFLSGGKLFCCYETTDAGKGFYCLDVSDPDAPPLLFKAETVGEIRALRSCGDDRWISLGYGGDGSARLCEFSVSGGYRQIDSVTVTEEAPDLASSPDCLFFDPVSGLAGAPVYRRADGSSPVSLYFLFKLGGSFAPFVRLDLGEALDVSLPGEACGAVLRDGWLFVCSRDGIAGVNVKDPSRIESVSYGAKSYGARFGNGAIKYF